MSGGIISGLGIYAAPGTSQDMARAGKAADECMQKLEGGKTTVVCFETIQRHLKNSPRKTKEAAVTIIYYRLRLKYPYIGGIVYLDEVRDDLLKRIAAKNNGTTPSEAGVRLVRFIDIYARAYRCVDKRYAFLNIQECMALIRGAPLDRSLTAQLHVIRLIEDLLKRVMPAETWKTHLYPLISILVYNLIGDTI
jgi:hypothetical protein